MVQETRIINEMAKLDWVSNTRLISKINSNIQRSDISQHYFRNMVQEWVEGYTLESEEKVNPTSAIPKRGDFALYVYQFSWEILENHGDKDFQRLKCWTNEEQEEAVLVYRVSF